MFQNANFNHLSVSEMAKASQSILFFFCYANKYFVHTTPKSDVRKGSAVPDMPIQI